MFRGHYPTRLDEKGRLKMPADFKREIDRSYDDQFYITSRDGKVIQLYPMKEWELIEAKAVKESASNQAVQKFLNTTSYYGLPVTMDSQSRLTIAERLRDKFGLKGEVAVIGKLNFIEIQLQEEYSKQVEGATYSPEDLDELKRVGI